MLSDPCLSAHSVQANFFRDRKWLNIEFPQLVAATLPDVRHRDL